MLYCYYKPKAKARKKEAMTTKEYSELIDQTIESNDLHGRSFTAGVALYTLLVDGYFTFNDELEDIERRLADAVAFELEADGETVYKKLSTRALAEAVDISVLDEIARELSVEAEA